MNNSQLAHAWAHQTKESGRASSFYYEGDTIYSYGSHFPIAKHYEGIILFTLRGYSNSTAKHINHTRRAVTHLKTVYCFDIPTGKQDTQAHERNLHAWSENIQASINAIETARKPEIYVDSIRYNVEQVNAYVKLFRIKLSKEQKKIFSVASLDKYKKIIAEAAEARDKIINKIKQEGAPIFARWREAWGQYNETIFRDTLPASHAKTLQKYFKTLDANTVFIRANSIEVETSKGVRVPLDVAERFYKWYMRIQSIGGCSGNCKETILGYTVTRANSKRLVVGCHDISREEIDSIAAKCKWGVPLTSVLN